MLCSISTGKSGSNWLDRLRSSKGFPIGDNLELDHFLANPNPSDSPITYASNSPNSNSESIHSNDKQLQIRKPPSPEVISSEPAAAGDREWFGIMSNVLSELFNMGEQAQSSRFSRKKTSRKQTNPRICIVKTHNVNSSKEQEKSSSNNVRKDQNFPASTTSLNPREETKSESKEEGQNSNLEEEEEEKEKGEKELLGYSRSEVTVIDTSCEVWKADKLIFRRKNIWKVKDKKGKSRTFGRKKRKPPPSPPPLLRPLSDHNSVGVCNKKPKISNSELRSLKETSGRDCGSLSNHNTPGDKGEEVHNEAPEDLTQVLRKRFPFSRLPRKSGKGNLSVILVKAIPKGKKNGAKLAKNRLKDPLEAT
ncbi:hypothetical protein REPUB_Repub07fG0160300 [Reevesia pubescens]